MVKVSYIKKFGMTVLLVGAFLLPLLTLSHRFVKADNGEFSLQVSPSPIIDAIKPATPRTIDFQIRNNGTRKEDLRIDLRKFTVSEDGQVNLSDEAPNEVKDWISVSNPEISLEPGSSFTEHLNINPPSNIGFSYNFSIMVARSKEPIDTQGKTKIKGSIAIFTLLAVDRPGAERKFDIVEFSSKKRLYEYLPAEFTLKLKNTGNTIVQPYGNIYIQKSANSTQPISVQKLNPNNAYLLPGVTRSLPIVWRDGFPVFNDVKTADNVPAKQKLDWDLSKAQNLRFGKYYAKVVAVYNDGQRDVPIESTISFWVIPWKILLIFAVLLVILIVGLFTILKKPVKSIKQRKSKKSEDDSDSEETS